MKNFHMLYSAECVKRWHTQDTIKEQTIAAHQWGVALIIMEIAPGDNQLLEAALCHDLGEVVTGDIPYPKPLGVKKLTEEAEWGFAKEHNLPLSTLLSDEQNHCLKWADMCEALLFLIREASLGNIIMAKRINIAMGALRSMGPPNKRAQNLLENLNV